MRDEILNVQEEMARQGFSAPQKPKAITLPESAFWKMMSHVSLQAQVQKAHMNFITKL